MIAQVNLNSKVTMINVNVLNSLLKAREHCFFQNNICTVFFSKKNEIFPFAITQKELECFMISEISQTEKDKISYNFTYMWSLKKKRKEKRKERKEKKTNSLINTENKLVVARGQGVGNGQNR